MVKHVNQKRITNSKDLRKLRAILPDPVARAHFMDGQGDIDPAMLRLAPPAKQPKSGVTGDLESALEAMKHIPWTVLQELKGDPDVLKKIEEAEIPLRNLRSTLTS